MTRLGVGTAVLAAAMFAGSLAAAEVAPVCSTWNRVSTPSTGHQNSFTALDASGSNVWAVGHEWSSFGTRDGAPLVMRFDGSVWAAEPLPDLSYLGVEPTLAAVAIAPAGDPWVVGSLRDSAGQNSPLILQSKGGFWQTYPVNMVNSFAPRFVALRDVAAVADNDAWAIGAAGPIKGVIEPFAARWDGLAWSEVAMPAIFGQRSLAAVSAVGLNDVWAVGHDVLTGTTPTDARGTSHSYARIYRWDGLSWAVVDHPVMDKPGSALQDIVALAANDIWAVGTIGTETGLFLHWDGSIWTVSPAPPGFIPQSVDGAASNDVWAAGAAGNAHWDGTSWTVLPSSEANRDVRRVIAVAGPCNAWSVTTSTDINGSASLVDRLGPAAVAPAAPEMPLAFVAKLRASKEIILNWLPGGDPTGAVGQTAFVIERCDGVACDVRLTALDKVAGKDTSYVDAGLDPQTSYSYRIYAVNEGGTSKYTATSTAVTPVADPPSSPLPDPVIGTQPGTVPSARPANRVPRPSTPPVAQSEPFMYEPRPTPPPTPLDFVAKAADSKEIFLSWASGDPTGGVGDTTFVIERCVGEAGACETRIAAIVKLDGKAVSYADSGLQPGTAYTYRIYAINEVGKSEPSAATTAVTLAGDTSSPFPVPGTKTAPGSRP